MSAPYAVFCSDPLEPRSVEPDFSLELAAARDAGFSPILVDHDELDQRINPSAALKKARITEPSVGVYRGWMLRSEAYRALFDGLAERGVRLLSSPEDYETCHYAPGSYSQLKAWMANTVWIPKSEIDDQARIRVALDQFGASPVILKDFVKSQAAGYWAEACYIPDASDTAHVDRVVARFRELQGDSLTGGLVFKAYVPLRPTGAPAHEYRAFFVGHHVVGCWPRSRPAGELGSPPNDLLAQIALKVPGPFVSADFGMDDMGKWWLLEVGDGQVSGLPDPEAAGPLFSALAEYVLRASRA